MHWSVWTAAPAPRPRGKITKRLKNAKIEKTILGDEKPVVEHEVASVGSPTPTRKVETRVAKLSLMPSSDGSSTILASLIKALNLEPLAKSVRHPVRKAPAPAKTRRETPIAPTPKAPEEPKPKEVPAPAPQPQVQTQLPQQPIVQPSLMPQQPLLMQPVPLKSPVQPMQFPQQLLQPSAVSPNQSDRAPSKETGTESMGTKKRRMRIRNVAIDKRGQVRWNRFAVDDDDDEEEKKGDMRNGGKMETKFVPSTSSTSDGKSTHMRDGPVLYPHGGVFDKRAMLNFFSVVHGCPPPPETSGLVVGFSPAMKWRKPDPRKWQDQKKNEGAVKTSTLKPTRLQRAQTREDALSCGVRGLLNKISPDNQKVIVEQLADIDLYSAEELHLVIQIIFKKALDEPHYCETYADMVQNLKSWYPEFPAEEGGKPLTFVRALVNTCQIEFESLPASLDPPADKKIKMVPEEVQEFQKKCKDRALANMKFIGHLYLRRLLAAKIISEVVHDLLTHDDGIPEEHKVECALELLQNVGYTLEKTPQGEALITKFASRLMDLKRLQGADSKPALSKRVQFGIQDLLDLRKNGWRKKMLRDQAKKIDDVRRDAVMTGHTPSATFQTATMGMRPSEASPPSSYDKRRGGR